MIDWKTLTQKTKLWGHFGCLFYDKHEVSDKIILFIVVPKLYNSYQKTQKKVSNHNFLSKTHSFNWFKKTKRKKIGDHFFDKRHKV